jgi:hypothetical protein
MHLYFAFLVFSSANKTTYTLKKIYLTGKKDLLASTHRES